MRKKSFLLQVAIFLVLLENMACSEKAKRLDLLKQQVAEWTERQIYFPSNMVFMRYALDTVPFDISDKEYKILVYTDSVGCVGCKLQLSRWQDMITLTDSVVPEKVNYLFLFSAGNINNVRHLLKQAGLMMPVSIDDGDKFKLLNRIPDDPNFQTFLLNQDNRVVAVGNPAYSPSVREIYIQRIQDSHSRANTTRSPGQTTVSLDKTEFNLGKFTMRDKRTLEIVVTNSGNHPLALIEAVSSCGCTNVTFGKEPVLPGKTTSVQVCFTPKETGMFSKTIVLYANIKEPIVLTLRGEIIP